MIQVQVSGYITVDTCDIEDALDIAEEIITPKHSENCVSYTINLETEDNWAEFSWYNKDKEIAGTT